MIKPKPVIGVANQKGGVGKTTDLRAVAEYLAKYVQKKGLLIDFDTQYSLTARYLGIHKNPVTDFKEPPIHDSYDPKDPETANWDGRSTIANIFYGEPVIPYKTRIPNLEIMPADEYKLRQAEEVKRQEIAEKVHSQLYRFITMPDLQNEYDFFCIDTPPAKGPLTIAAFKAMTHLIIPLELEIQAVEGLQGILTLWKQESLQRPADYPLTLLGILPSKVHSRRSDDKRILQEIKEMVGELLIPHQLNDRAQYPNADRRNQSIFDLPDSDEAKQECINLGKYISERVF